MRRTTSMLLMGVVAALPMSGCAVGGWGSKVHVSGAEDHALATAGIEMFDAKTHNGHINVSAGEGDEIIVHVKKKAYGSTMASAEEAMEALEIVTEQEGDVQKLYWRWSEMKRGDWSAGVTYDVVLPARLAVKLRTHNGPVKVAGTLGDTAVRTHNGKVEIDNEGAVVQARTHNGGVSITAPVREVMARTHNGGVSVCATGEHNVTGMVRTHNGGVSVRLNESASAKLKCKTHNGGISTSLPFKTMNKTRRSMSATYGEASGELTVQTHNGGIRIKKG